MGGDMTLKLATTIYEHGIAEEQFDSLQHYTLQINTV